MKRDHFLRKINQQFRVHPVCGLLGPRQVGKTTLAKMFAEQQELPVHLFHERIAKLFFSIQRVKAEFLNPGMLKIF